MVKLLGIPGFILILILAQVVVRPDYSRGADDEVDDFGKGTENAIATPRGAGRNQQGLYELNTPRLTLITDIPMDDELKSWPGLFEQSIQQLQAYFGVDSKVFDGLHVTATLIGDRERFKKLGVLDNVPAFDEGYQLGDNLYIREQPTVYFRRLLFLHEATHWIVWRLYGGGGSPWFMEGMAEMQGTHSLTDGRLKLGVLPSSRELVSGWGRLRMIDETLNQGAAPSMSEILAYGNQREDHVIRYAWSWAACVFFTNHPKYGPVLRELYDKKLDYSNSLSFKFKKRLAAEWADVLVDWNAFVSDLDFGYDLQRSRFVSGDNTKRRKLNGGVIVNFPLETDRGWQATGIMLEIGKPVRITCSGKYILKKPTSQSDSNWVVEPQGVTYEFFRGNPLGCVIASVVPRDEVDQTERWKTIRIGRETEIVPDAVGELFLKVNEPSKGLWDNAGSISTEISSK